MASFNGDSGDNYIIGTTGDDTLNGNEGNDSLLAGQGNDLIVGGRGSDTVYFNIGDGNDIIDNTSDDTNTTTDICVFGEGITFNDLQFVRYNNSPDSTGLCCTNYGLGISCPYPIMG